MRKLSLAYILEQGIEEANHQFKPAFIAMLWPTWALGLVRSLEHLWAFLGFHFAGKIIKKFKTIKTIIIQHFLSWGNALIFVGFPNFFSPLALSINSFFFGLGSTAEKSLLHKEFSDKQRATMSSLNSLAGNLFFSLLIFIIGLIADAWGPVKALLLGEFLIIIVIPIYWKWLK